MDIKWLKTTMIYMMFFIRMKNVYLIHAFLPNLKKKNLIYNSIPILILYFLKMENY